MASKTRTKMVWGAVDLLRRRGLNGTSIREVVRHTNTPRGSVRHHFPGGKLQIVRESLGLAGDEVAVPLKQLVEEAGVVAGLDAFIAAWRTILVKSAFKAGCPVLAVSVEQYLGEDGMPDEKAQAELMKLTADIFAAWRKILADGLRREGVPAARAVRLSTLVVASIEGTVALCRAEENVKPLDDVAKELTALLSTAMAQCESSRPN